MPKQPSLTPDEARTVVLFIERFANGMRKALAKWQAAAKVSDAPQVQSNIRYCKQSLGLLANIQQAALLITEDNHGSERGRGDAETNPEPRRRGKGGRRSKRRDARKSAATRKTG